MVYLFDSKFSAWTILTGLSLILLAAIGWLHLAAPINLITADLGRHIRNGEFFLTNYKAHTTNFYAYTYPDFFAPCHHWGIGVIFYALWKAGGFMGLSWAHTALLFITFGLALWSVRGRSFFGAVLLVGVLVLPLLGYRTEIRPESVSTFFLVLEFVMLDAFFGRRMRGCWLWVLPFIHIAWVNIHILFFCGLILMGCFWLALLIENPRDPRVKFLGWIILGSLGASFVNPFVLGGVFEPAKIMQGYGYKLAENQNVFFMMHRFPGRVIYGYFLTAFAATVMLVAARVWKERDYRRSLPHLLAVIIFGGMGVFMVRMIAMAGFIFIPAAVVSLGQVTQGVRWGRRLILILAAGLIFLAAVVPIFYLSPLRDFQATSPVLLRNSLFAVLMRPQSWGGLAPEVERSADFFKSAGLKGPLFNNYDIGGYLIFHLFPRERPFVDNRPEAYPESFFRTVYGPMQQDEALWQEKQQQYGFELIYFYRHDMTEWGQPFLIRRLNDPLWAPVYVDAYTIILARRNGVNQRIIENYELPRSLFRVSS